MFDIAENKTLLLYIPLHANVAVVTVDDPSVHAFWLETRRDMASKKFGQFLWADNNAVGYKLFLSDGAPCWIFSLIVA